VTTSYAPSLKAKAAAELERRRREHQALSTLRVGGITAFTEQTKIQLPQDTGSGSAPFILWPAQRTLLNQMTTEKLLVTLKARQLGISWLVCAYALWLCLLHPGQTVLLFSQGQTEANELINRIRFLYTEHQQLRHFPLLNTDNTQTLEWSNTSRVMSLPATRKAGRSFTASLTVLDEFAFMLFGQELFAAAKPTIDDGGQMFVISSADGNGTPYHRFWQAAQNGKNGFVPVFLPWQARPDRPADFRVRKEAEAFGDTAPVKREYPENDIEAFTNAAGLIYDVWSDGPENGNVTEDAEYVRGVGSLYWAIDDGYSGGRESSFKGIDHATGKYVSDSHPRVFLLIQVKPDGHIDIFAEHYACQLIEEEHLKMVQELGYEEPTFVAIDKSAAQLRARLQSAGIYTKNSPADVEESIKELRRRLAPDDNGWRAVRVHPRCTQLRAEMASYRRDSNGKILKQFDHGPDALRYFTWLLRYS
jgi:hypothetical protein